MAEAKRYRAEFIEPGLVGYTVDGRREMVLVKKDILDKMLPSFLGKPVFDYVHRSDVSPDQAFDMSEDEQYNRADGVISDVGYNEETAKYYADLMIWDGKTQENIDDNGFSVSCAYRVTEAGPGGKYNGLEYDEEVIDGFYHHMAIVDDPRYTASRIYENSNDGGKIMKFRLGKKRENAEDPKPTEEPKENGLPVDDKENMGEIPADAMVEINGQMVPVSELVAAYEEKQEPAAPAENVLNMDDTVAVGEKEVSVKDLVENYCSKMENAEPPTDTPMEDPIKENAGDKPVADDPKNFRIIQNAADRGAAIEKPNVNTKSARLARGRAGYSSAVSNGGDK